MFGLSNIARNWQTTTAGVLVIIGTLLHFIFPGKPETVDAVEKGLAEILPVLIQLVVGVGLLLSKDGNKTGVAPEPKDIPGMGGP